MNELLREILLRADTRDASAYDSDEVERWPPGTIERLQKLGVLREAEPANGLVCRECEDGCWIEPAIRDDPASGQAFGTYVCRRHEAVGRFTVDLARLRCWALDPGGLAASVARAAKLSPVPTELSPGRSYFLGTVQAEQRTHELFLFRGLVWPDAAGVVASSDRLRGAARPLVLVPAKVPPRDFWPSRPPTVVSLAETAMLTARGMKLDLSGHLAAAADGEEEWITVTEAAVLLAKDFNTVPDEVKGKVSINATRKKFRTNGKKGTDRRIELHSFNSWRLAQRDKDLNAEDW